MRGTIDPPVIARWRTMGGRAEVVEYARTHYRCSQCRRYFRDVRGFVGHLDDSGECAFAPASADQEGNT